MKTPIFRCSRGISRLLAVRCRRTENARGRTKFDTTSDKAAQHELIVDALRGAAACPDHDEGRHAADVLEKVASAGRNLEVAADTAAIDAVRATWEAGWLPSDLHEFARRKLEPSAVEFLAAAVVLESKRYSVSTLHPRWRGDLAAVSAVAGIDVAAPLMSRMAADGMSRCVALAIVLKVLALLCRLPALEPLLPLPGAGQQENVASSHVDEKALSKVRALLAKAEATKFPEEAEAFSAKAQELMSRYSLHQAVVDHERGDAPAAAVRRVWIESPYVL